MIEANANRETLLTRENILKLLSDDEVAAVSTAETIIRFKEGEEYLDLEHLDRGVQKAHGATQAIGQTLERKAVHPKTWAKILLALKP
jgi:hypothetical protein